jgi:hypothetical protein
MMKGALRPMQAPMQAKTDRDDEVNAAAVWLKYQPAELIYLSAF